MTASYDIAIVGAGVVGVAFAREMASRYQAKIVILEKEDGPARHASGKNSGVVHSGFNLKPGSLKATLCVQGSAALRAYCKEHGIPMREAGTLVVAFQDEQVKVLEELVERGKTNGVPGVRLITQAELRTLEPHAAGVAALHSPTGGVVDAPAFVHALLSDAVERGVELRTRFPVRRVTAKSGGIVVSGPGGVVTCRYLVNCAGLYADRLAHQMAVGRGYTIVPFRGEYYDIVPQRAFLVSSMLYPPPDLKFPFLGVHFTKSVHGVLSIGPNATIALGRENYRAGLSSPVIALASPRLVREAIAMALNPSFFRLLTSRAFLQAAWQESLTSLSKRVLVSRARQLVPELRMKDVVRGKSGIRAQLVNSRGHLVEDFVVEHTEYSTHVLNAVSPGLTSSLAFARFLVDRLANEGRLPTLARR